MVGLGVVAAALWGYGIGGLFHPWVHPSRRFGMLVLAANVSAWALALWLLP